MTKKILLSIFLICIALTLYFKFISNTTIYDIENNPDKYIDKKVTVTGRPGESLAFRVKGTLGELKGFYFSDINTHNKGNIYFPASIFVNYAGDIPSKVIKDKWDRDKYVRVKVTGIVRHKMIKLGFKESGMFYIEGESWEYVD
jgi:hypothetical protein